MKANEFNIRPGLKEPFSVYWHYDINKAKDLYSGSKEYCEGVLQMINEALSLINYKVFSEFEEEKFCDFEDVEGEMLQIMIGGLLFEFVSRDFHDGAGGEVNCECFILGKDTGYGYTGGFNLLDGKIEKEGIPYDDEYCMNYYHKDTNHDFEKTRQLVIDEISEFVVTNSERLCYALEKNLTWESIRG